MAVLYVILALVPVLVSLLLRPLHLPHPFLLESNVAHQPSPRILLLTAHPDDEAFFFGPTLTSLIPSLSAPISSSSAEKASDTIALTSPQVYSLCLSVGDADGLGEIRRRELGDSLDILGVAEDRRWILDKSEFQDGIHVRWDANLIADTVYKYVSAYNISIILTFDSYGVSGHPNHFSLYHGVSHLLAASPAGIPYHLVAYSLKSKPIIIKYTGILAPMLIKFKLISLRALGILVNDTNVSNSVFSVRPVFVAGINEYRRTVIAALRHQSQHVWFRWLYLAFSQYMWVNEWERIHAVADRRK